MSQKLKIGRWSALAAAALVFGCAAPVTQRIGVSQGALADEEQTQLKVAIQARQAFNDRLSSVSYPVLKSAAKDCGKVVIPRLGFSAPNRDALPEKNREAIASVLSIGADYKVRQVYKESAAEAAGMKVGDLLLNPEQVVRKRDEKREDAISRLPAGVPINVSVMRNGERLNLPLVPEMVCDYPVTMTDSSEVNAYADGKGIFVTRGMMRFAADDRELAMVLAHELAHNTMGHIDKSKTNAMLGSVLDILAAAYRINTQSAFSNAAAKSYSQDFEAEADYVGLYYLAGAGYQTEGAANFWRRMAAEHPANIKTNHSASHPATAERFLALEKVNLEIAGKQQSGASLVPNLKK